MAKSTIAAILEAQRVVNALDKRGRLAILRDLQKQDFGPGKAGLSKPAAGLSAIKPITYQEGEE